jgi:hypothetical protein
VASPSPSATSPASVVIDRGSLIFLRLLDVADELDLDRFEARMRGASDIRRVELRHESTAALALEARPIELQIGKRTVALGSTRSLDTVVRAHVFRFGVVSIEIEWPIPSGSSLRDLVPLAALGWESQGLDEVARAVFAEIEPHVRGATDEPLYRSLFVERYGVLFVESLDRSPLDDADSLARVLLGEADPRPLAEATREDAIARRFAYFDEDLAIPHAAAALVLDPSGSRDALLALELAASQLVDLRAYDELIDHELDEVYRELGRAKGAGWWLFGRRHRALSRRAQERMVELSELADRAENAVKVTSDLSLARLYLAALARMQVPSWRASVSRKLELFAQVYDVLKEESQAQRSLMLEMIIVILILFEIVMALLGS